MKENEIQNKIRAACNSGSNRLFRNNVGKVKGIDGRFHTFGLCKGSSDLIGFHKMTITPEMVGRTVAIFTAVECKSPTGKPTLEQQNFIAFIRSQGGIAGIARSETDALTLIQNY